MVVSVEAVYEDATYPLEKDNKTGFYTAKIEPIKKFKVGEESKYCPIMLCVTDNKGNAFTKTISDVEIKDDLLLIKEEQLFPLKFIVANEKGEELGYVKEANYIDLELGENNDFELEFSTDAWKEEAYNWGYRIFIPNTEYGGLLEERKTSTGQGTVTWLGYTWRGLLSQKIIQQPDNQTHLVVSGDANKIIKDIIGRRFDSLFVVETEVSGIEFKNYQFDRYCTVLDGLEKMLASKQARLKISYKQGTPGLLDSAVLLSAVPITDWSEYLEYSQDGRLTFTTEDYRRGINHLICAGEGEGIERQILHLYVQKDGSIGETQYYTGLEEREALYSYTSMEDLEQLKKDGIKHLESLRNYSGMEAHINNVDVDIGDIVGGRDRVTGMSIQPVFGKILTVKNNEIDVEYKLKGAK
mgnify:CR=1 FL=1